MLSLILVALQNPKQKKVVKVVKKVAKPSKTIAEMAQNELCLVDSIIPDEPPIVSFFGNGNCSKSDKLNIYMNGTHNNVEKDLYKAAGFKFVQNFEEQAHLIACTIGCFTNKSLNVNHVMKSQSPGSTAFVNKDHLDKNIKQFEALHPESHSIIPKTFTIPEELDQLKKDNETWPGFYIRKPSASSRGRGIELVKLAEEMEYAEPAIVQRYEDNLVLVNGFKFDMRVYVLVTNMDPYVAYFYPEGLARFATHQFQRPSFENYKDAKMHLTNFAINSADHLIKDLGDGMMNKWKLSELLDYLPQHPELFDQNVTVTKPKLLKEIQHTLEKVFAATYNDSLKIARPYLDTSYPTKYYGVYGADLCLLRNGKMKIFEVNIGPALETSNQLDFEVKFPMLREAMDLVGFRSRQWHFQQSLADEDQFDGWFDDSLDLEEKRVLMQLVDESLRQHKWIRLEMWSKLAGKWNSLVHRTKGMWMNEARKRA